MTTTAIPRDDWEFECRRTCDQVDADCKRCPIEQKCKDLTKILRPDRVVN